MWKLASLAAALVAVSGCFDYTMFPSTCSTGEGQAVVGVSTNPERFVDNGDGTVTDAKTGLVWEKAPAPVDVLWTEVAHACKPRGPGWRVPAIDELRSLLVGCPATEPGGACPISTTCKSVENCADRDACAGCVTADAEAHSSFFDAAFSFCTEQALSHEVAFWSSTIATSGCESLGTGGCTPYYVNATTGAVDYGQGVFDFGGPTYEVLCVRDGVLVEENPPVPRRRR